MFTEKFSLKKGVGTVEVGPDQTAFDRRAIKKLDYFFRERKINARDFLLLTVVLATNDRRGRAFGLIEEIVEWGVSKGRAITSIKRLRGLDLLRKGTHKGQIFYMCHPGLHYLGTKEKQASAVARFNALEAVA